MTTTARPIARLPGHAAPRTRQTDRQSASGTVLVQSSHGERATKRLRDISTHGCNLVGETDWLRMGIFVTISLSSERSIQAIVRWVRGDACGVEFLRPIPDAEADWIADRLHGF
ncbi:MAG: hypothetical protein RLZZ84_1821 [Pseudomonadota bacterium]|jgi:hypothetical protein